MKCDVCSGEGTVPQDYPPGTDLHIRQVTCRRCGGSGKARCGIVGPVEGMHQDGACILEPRHGGKVHKNASGNEWPVDVRPAEKPEDAVVRWRSYGRDMLEVIESDSNAGGLADYIDELRAEASRLREARQLVLDWVGKQGCHCESVDADDPHTGACPGVAERLLKGQTARPAAMKHVAWSCGGDGDSCRRAWCEKHEGNLFMCAVCGQAEGDLEPSCPGPKVKTDGEPKTDSRIERPKGVSGLLLWCDSQERGGPNAGLDRLDIRETGGYVRQLERELESRGDTIRRPSIGMEDVP